MENERQLTHLEYPAPYRDEEAGLPTHASIEQNDNNFFKGMLHYKTQNYRSLKSLHK